MIALYIPMSKADRRVCSGKYSSGICIQYGVPMYSACTCIYTVCTCICNVHTCFNQLSQQQILVGILGVYTCMYKKVDIPMSKAVQESMQWQMQCTYIF